MKFWNYTLQFKQLKVRALLSIIALFLSSSLSGQIITLGTGTTVTGTSTASPINIFYESLRCQIVYTRAEINAAGVFGASDLNRLGFYIDSPPNVPMPNWTVKMKHTTAANVAAHDGTGLSTHLIIPSYMPVAGGFQMLNLTTPFNWNGVDNILIDICFDPVSNWSSSGTVRYYTLNNGFRYVRQDGVGQCAVNTNTTATNKPQIQMDFAAPFPMVYDSVQALHPTISSVLIGTNNNQILQAKIKTTGGLNALDVSSLVFTTNGSTNPTGDISNARLYYTGSSDIFSTATQFGTAIANPNGTMTFNGTVTLNAGFSYFWLVYDVPPTATSGNVLDATLTSVTVDNIVRTPSNGNPGGNRPIVNLYANIPHVEGFESTWINGGSTRDLPSIHWLNTPNTNDESWRRDDDGASASWSSTGGTYTPSGSNANNASSNRSARFHSYDVLTNASGTLDLYLNFSPTGIKVLDFDIINTSGTDKLDILFSDNAGATFTPIGTSYGTHANWTRYKNITLSSTTSNTCILRFKGTGDFGVSDIGLDNIYVRVPPPFDAGVVNTNSSLCDGHVNVLIQNYGSQPITGFDVTYVLNGVTTTENVGSLTIQPNQQATYSFAATVVGAGPHNIFAYTVLTSDGLALNDTSAVSICYNKPLISTFPYFMDFESGQNGWSSGGTLNSWAFGKPAKATINTAASGVKAWVTGGLTGQHNNNENSYVLSPCYDFSSLNNPIIKLKVWWECEGSFDGAALQASTDGGLSWVTIGDDNDPMNWYNDNSISGNPGGQQMGWTGQTGGFTFVGSGGWVLAQHKLDGLANQPSVSLRIVFGAEGSGTDDGFAFDDVFIGEGPVANLPDQLVLCSGDTLTLDPGAFADYDWIPTGDSIRFLPVSAPGFYIVRVADADGFSDTDTIEVIGSVFNLELGPKKLKCPEEILNITTSLSGYDYLWNDGTTNPDINVITAGFYSVTVTDQFGCQRKDTVEVGYFALPTVALGNDTTICGNSFVEMNAGNAFPGSTYLWNTGDTTQRLLVTAPGTYAVKVTTIEGCSVTDSIRINNIPSPVLNLGPDINQCTNLNVTLHAGNPGCTYLWSTNATSQNITVTQPGVYSVRVTNANGCFVNDTIVVGFDPAAQVSLGPDVQSCTPVLLEAGVNSSFYIWSTGESTSSIMATTTGTYIVQVGTPQGCVALDTVNVTIFPGLNAAIAVLDTVYVQDTVQFADATFPIPTSWNWNFGSNVSNLNNPTHVFDSVGTYTVSLTVSKNGCMDSVTKDVVVIVKPVAVDPMQNLTSFLLYPNPNRGQFKVQAEWSQAEAGQIVISDLSGKTLESKSFENQMSLQQHFDISHLSAGYYFLTLQTNKGKVTTKIVLY